MLALLAALALSQVYPPSQVNPIINGSVVSASGGPRVIGNLFGGDIDLEVSLGAVTGGGSIVFTMTAADPLNPSATQAASVSTPSLSNGSNPVVAILHAAHTSSVQVSWTVTGTFSAAMWVSVVNITPSEIQGIDGGFPVFVTGIAGGGSSWDSGVLVQNFPSILPDGGLVGAAEFGNWSVQAVIDGGLTISVVPFVYADVFVDGGNVAVSNLPSILPDGGAVSAYQGGNWSVQATIDGGVPVTGLPSILPDGGSVAAGELGNWAVLMVYDGGTIPLDVKPATQSITAQDVASTSTGQADGQNAITGSPTANSFASFSTASMESVEIQVTGTWTGTLIVEKSSDTGTTWFTEAVHLPGTAYTAGSFTGNFTGGANVAGATNVRVRSTAAWTGTATVLIVESSNSQAIYVLNPLTLRDSTTQSVSDTIKAASTAPVAADTALVVALSPNSYSAAAPINTDTSAQTLDDAGVVLCANGPATAIPRIANAKSQSIMNNSSSIVCLGDVPGLNCPPAFDAGATTAWLQLPPGGIFSFSDGLPHFCMVSGTALVSPDAGLGWHDSN